MKKKIYPYQKRKWTKAKRTALYKSWQQDIFKWCKANGRLPDNAVAKSKEEKLMSSRMQYFNKNSKFRLILKKTYGVYFTSKAARANKFRKQRQEVMKWAKNNGRLPSRYSKSETERYMANMANQFFATNSLTYSPRFKSTIQKLFGVKSRNKRKHNVKKHRKEVLDFLKENKRVPSSLVESEKTIHGYFRGMVHSSHNGCDERFLNKVLKLDPCFRTRVPNKYRKSINTALEQAELTLKKEIKLENEK